MEDNIGIIVATVALTYVALRLYRRYKGRSETNAAESKQNRSLRHPKEDEYEPYSKK